MEWSKQVTEALETGWLEVAVSGPTVAMENEWWDACTAEERPFIVFRTSGECGSACFDMFTCRPGMRNKLIEEGMNKVKELQEEYLNMSSAETRELLLHARKERLGSSYGRSADNVYGPAVGEILLRREDQHRFMPKLAAVLCNERFWLSERVPGLGPIPGQRQTTRTRGEARG